MMQCCTECILFSPSSIFLVSMFTHGWQLVHSSVISSLKTAGSVLAQERSDGGEANIAFSTVCCRFSVHVQEPRVVEIIRSHTLRHVQHVATYIA